MTRTDCASSRLLHLRRQPTEHAFEVSRSNCVKEHRVPQGRTVSRIRHASAVPFKGDGPMKRSKFSEELITGRAGVDSRSAPARRRARGAAPARGH